MYSMNDRFKRIISVKYDPIVIVSKITDRMNNWSLQNVRLY